LFVDDDRRELHTLRFDGNTLFPFLLPSFLNSHYRILLCLSLLLCLFLSLLLLSILFLLVPDLPRMLTLHLDQISPFPFRFIRIDEFCHRPPSSHSNPDNLLHRFRPLLKIEYPSYVSRSRNIFGVVRSVENDCVREEISREERRHVVTSLDVDDGEVTELECVDILTESVG